MSGLIMDTERLINSNSDSINLSINDDNNAIRTKPFFARYKLLITLILICLVTVAVTLIIYAVVRDNINDNDDDNPNNIIIANSTSSSSSTGSSNLISSTGNAPAPPDEIITVEFSILLLGQSLLRVPNLYDLTHNGFDYNRLIHELSDAHFVVTDAEFTCKSPYLNDSTVNFTPARTGESGYLFSHIVDCNVLDELYHNLTINTITCANNHAWDLNVGGVDSMMLEADMNSIDCIGLGLNKDIAAQTANIKPKTLTNISPYQHYYQNINNLNISINLLSFASGSVNVNATGNVNTIGFDPVKKQYNVIDLQRQYNSLNAIQNQYNTIYNNINNTLYGVIHHNHNWLDDNNVYSIEPWRIKLAHDLIDNHLVEFYASHGKPSILAIEIYKGRPICYGLGNLFFQTHTNITYWPFSSWQGVTIRLNYKVQITNNTNSPSNNVNFVSPPYLSSIIIRPYKLLNEITVYNTTYRGLPIFNISYTDAYTILTTLAQQSQQLFSTNIQLFNFTNKFNQVVLLGKIELLQ